MSYNYAGTLIDLKCKAKKTKLGKIFNVIKRIIKLSFYQIKFKIDYTFSSLNSANRINILTLGLTKKIISIRGYGDYVDNKKMHYRWMRKANITSVQTNRLKNDIVNEYKDVEKKIVIIGNPFDINKIENLSSDEVDSEYIICTQGKKVLVTVGAFKYAKNFSNLLKSFELVKQEYDNVILTIIGHRGEEEQKILDMVKKSKYSKDIILLGYQSNPFKYLRLADIFLCSSYTEGFPNAFVESMICNCAIVSTNCMTGPIEILNNGQDVKINKNGYSLLQYGILTKSFKENLNFDYRVMAEENYYYANAVLEFLNNNELLEKYKELSKEKSNDFSMDKFTNDIIALIEND